MEDLLTLILGLHTVYDGVSGSRENGHVGRQSLGLSKVYLAPS